MNLRLYIIPDWEIHQREVLERINKMDSYMVQGLNLGQEWILDKDQRLILYKNMSQDLIKDIIEYQITK